MQLNPIFKKIILVVLVGVLLPTLVFAQQTPAAGEPQQVSCGLDFFCHGLKLFHNIALEVGYLIMATAGFFISIAASFITILINLSSTVTSSVLVQEGFKISLSVANLGFVLAIIVMAYGTIFRFQGYGYKQILWKIVIAALLVNFSFIIAGTIIDFNNILGNFFVGAASPENIHNFADNLANSLSAQKLLSVKQTTSVSGSILNFGAAYIGLFASVAATAIFAVILVIVFFAVVFMLLLRYLWITFLLVLMPIVWLFWVFPAFSKYWSQWWDKFIKWNFFYPAATFFIYLSILSADRVGQIIKSAGSGQAAIAGANAITNVGSDMLITFIQMFIQVGILVGGLIAAQSMGIAGASAALQMAGNVKNKIMGVAGKVAGAPGVATGRVATGLIPGASGFFKKGGAAETLAGGLSRVGFKGAAASLYNVAASRQAAVGGIQKDELGKDSDGAILAKFNSFTTDKTRRAALVNEVVKRNLSEKVDVARLNSYLGDAKDMGATKEILASAPHLAGKVANLKTMQEKDPTTTEFNYRPRAIAEAMASFKPSKIDDLAIPALKDSFVVSHFNKEHLKRAGKEWTEKQRIEFTKTATTTLPNDHPVRLHVMESPAFQSAIEEVARGAPTIAAELIKKSLEEAEKKRKVVERPLRARRQGTSGPQGPQIITP